MVMVHLLSYPDIEIQFYVLLATHLRKVAYVLQMNLSF
jgi:hypothetical protein